MVTRIGPKRPVRLYLAEWRSKKGVTQEAAANRINTTKSTISKWETRGALGIISEEGRDLTVSALAALAEAYDIPVQNFYHHPDQPSPDELLNQTRRQIEEVTRTLLKTGTGE